MMKRTVLIAGLLAACLVGCDRNVEEISTYDPALDGPIAPVLPTTSPLMEGRPAGAISDSPAKPDKTAATAPVANPAVDTAKAEIDGRMEQIRKMIADGKFEDYERAILTPDELSAKLTEAQTYLQSAIDADRGNPDAALKSFEDIAATLKGQKPDVSADGTLATYKDKGGAAFILKKVDGVWYPSPVENAKAAKKP